VADKAINQLICSKNWETPITSMGSSKKQLNGMALICHDFEVEPALLLPYAQSLRSISENDKANQIMEKFDQISKTIVGKLLPKRKLYGCHKG
jgi:hypothetical protein